MIVGMLIVVCFMLGAILQGLLTVVSLLKKQNDWLMEDSDD